MLILDGYAYVSKGNDVEFTCIPKTDYWEHYHDFNTMEAEAKIKKIIIILKIHWFQIFCLWNWGQKIY